MTACEEESVDITQPNVQHDRNIMIEKDKYTLPDSFTKLIPFGDCVTIDQKYKALRNQVLWAVTHYGIVDTDGIFKHLTMTVKNLDR